MAATDDDWEPLSEAELKLLQCRRDRADQISKRMGDYLLKGYKMLAITCPICGTILLQTRQGNDYCVSCSELDSDADKDNPVLNQTAAMSMTREIELSNTATNSGVKHDKVSVASNPSPQPPSILSPQPPSIPSPQLPSIPALLDINTQPNAVNLSSQRPTVTPPTARTDQDQASLGITSIDIQCWPADSKDLKPKMPDSTSARSGGGDGDSGVRYTPGYTAGTQGEVTLNALTEKIRWATEELGLSKHGEGSLEYNIKLCQLIKAASEACVSVRAAAI